MNELRCIPSTSLDPPPEPVMDPCCLRCQECGETKSNPNTLFYHLFEYHNYDKARIARIREQRKTRSLHIKAVRQTRPLYLCNICGKQFLSKSGIITHSESIHKLTRDPPAGIHCPISSCAGRFYTYMELATHADVEHRNEAGSLILLYTR
ncbi:zinc finger, C2H2 type [Oesophagostomum dentatum]|uniref:Zinc finger, C2H2 type n=1 Tax=Oesophagostomum dentatum TaxID=61180 RepID=A0A0B1T6D7_OESDE|nr:zinc finger, C2H2 type [Oesophagostomum dentatum]